MGWTSEEVRVQVKVESKFFTSPAVPDRLCDPTRLELPGVKRPGREADHSSPTNFKVKKKMGLYIYFPI
jgi:hypothetical protein